MELIRGLQNLRPDHRGCVVTVGTFDGIHLGHKKVLEQLASVARRLGLPSVLVTFEPQPLEFFAPRVAPARLTRLREKLMVLDALPVDRVLCLRFNRDLAMLPPDEFIQRLLVDGLGARYVVVGDDFRFGRNRAGDLAVLKAAGERFGFDVARMETCGMGGARVSSTRVREALERGDLATAEELLGRRYSLCGRIMPGDRRGRTIGFPTANIELRRHVMPLSGVYLVTMSGIREDPLPGVANVGRRPTVDGTRGLLEVHLLDFDQNVYGRHVAVEFLRKLRNEQRFESLEALKRQINNDVSEARRYFREPVAGDQPSAVRDQAIER